MNNFTRREILKRTGMLAGAAAVTSTLGCTKSSSNAVSTNVASKAVKNGNNRPNIILITTHDSGRHFGCYGIPTVKTPAIDKLATEGVMFSNYFSVSPICSPSRGAAMTGRYPQSNGLTGLCHGENPAHLNPDEKHLAQLLRERGYQSILFRFQHEALWENWKQLGFEEFRAKEVTFFSETVPDEQAIVATKAAKEVVRFLDEYSHSSKQQPFYAQVGFFETHTPYQYGGVKEDLEDGVTVPTRVIKNEAAIKHFALLEGSVRVVDKAVGIICEGLKKHKLDKNTIVIFTSDHGLEGVRDKWTLYDHGLTIPLIMRWPDEIPARQKCNHLLSNVELTPTLLELIDETIPANMEGKSFAKSIFKPQTRSTRDAIFGYYGPQRCVRTEKYKLIVTTIKWLAHNYPADIIEGRKKENKILEPSVELFDIQKDPDETKNLATQKQYRKTLSDMGEKLLCWLQSTNDEYYERISNILGSIQ